MRELLNQDRAMSIGMAKLAASIVGMAFLITSLAIILLGLSTLIGGNLLPAVIQIFGGPALLLSIYLMLRLMIEILLGSHRANDRLGIMADTQRENREPKKDRV